MSQPETLGQDTVSQGLLSALREDEEALGDAYQRFMDAGYRLDVISRRYAAMREAVHERIGASPYSKSVRWPESSPGWPETHHIFRFRYTRMKMGDAITQLLGETQQPLSLEEITKALSQGSVYSRDTRAVNAALINTKGIVKLDDGRYIYRSEADEIDDLPF